MSTLKLATKVQVKELLAGLYLGTTSASLKLSFKARALQALTSGEPLDIMSLDLETYGPGDPRTHPDCFPIVVGLQPYHIEDYKFRAGPPEQHILERKVTAIDLLRIVHQRCKGFNATLEHFSRYDIGVLRSFEPIVRGKYPELPPLPPAMVDIMQPFRGLGVSASQEHLCMHYGLGEKGKVSGDIWNDAATGEQRGLPYHEVIRARERIRDERNRTCLAANFAQTIFISNNMRTLNKLAVREVYPNDAKMSELLGEKA